MRLACDFLTQIWFTRMAKILAETGFAHEPLYQAPDSLSRDGQTLSASYHAATFVYIDDAEPRAVEFRSGVVSTWGHDGRLRMIRLRWPAAWPIAQLNAATAPAMPELN
jgi:hypothetical protein